MSQSHGLGAIPSLTTLPLVGLEVDNLLAFLALLGLLRTLEVSRPSWRPRISWSRSPWRAELHLAETVDEAEVASACRSGIDAIVAHYDVAKRSDVNFEGDEFRAYLTSLLAERDELGVALATAIAVEYPRKKNHGSMAGPLVMMFGQGHQHFLERIRTVPRGDLPNKLKKLKQPPDLAHPACIERALFHPWQRVDRTDGFRWDAEEDQRYALRASDPSADGAAPTVHGANQLAAIGFLSFTSFPGRRATTRGLRRSRDETSFVWPIWREPLSLRGIEHLMAHRDVLRGRLRQVEALGVVEIFRANRVANGKYMNVTRARPMPPA